MKPLDARTGVDLVKLLVFALVTTLATGVLVVAIGNVTFGDTRTYRAVFVDATGLVEGDDVRVAGVKVGTVEEIEVVDRIRARVGFTVDEGIPLTGATRAKIRYRNLVGQRYVALEQGVGDTTPMAEGDTIGVERTAPALDLTVLFNGFKPLFRALSPSDLNTLATQLVRVFQGEGGTVEGLLGHTASLTSTLADRDRVIGRLVDNLNEVLVHLGDRDEELSSLIVTFRRLVRGLKDDRHAILDSLDSVSALSVETAGLVAEARAPLVADVQQLRRFAGNLDRNKAEIDRALQVLPIKLEKIGRTATYGSWFNFYLCEFKGRIVLPGGQAVEVPYQTGSSRCELG